MPTLTTPWYLNQTGKGIANTVILLQLLVSLVVTFFSESMSVADCNDDPSGFGALVMVEVVMVAVVMVEVVMVEVVMVEAVRELQLRRLLAPSRVT